MIDPMTSTHEVTDTITEPPTDLQAAFERVRRLYSARKRSCPTWATREGCDLHAATEE